MDYRLSTGSKKVHDVLLWGDGDDYDRLLSLIRFEELKGNINVIGMMSSNDMKWYSSRDGFTFRDGEQFRDIEFDYLIITVTRAFEGYREKAKKGGSGRKNNKWRNIYNTAF